MRKTYLTMLLTGIGTVAGCGRETPPPTVDEFLANKILLDAAMVRCTQNRATMKYEQECVVAREAANRIALAEEAERRKQLEAQSQRKRAALRRAQEAAEQARVRAAEAERLRREAEYLAQFGQVPAGAEQPGQPSSAEPGSRVAEMPAAGGAAIERDAAAEQGAPVEQGAPAGDVVTTRAPEDAGSDRRPPAQNVPPSPDAVESASDLESIREELQRRQEGNR